MIFLEKFLKMCIFFSFFFYNYIVFYYVDITQFFSHSPVVRVGCSQSFTTNITTGDNAIYVPFLMYAGRSVYLLNNFQELLTQRVRRAVILVGVD